MDLLSVTKTLLQGFGITVLIFVLTLVISLPLGLLMSFGTMSKVKPLSYPLKVFVWIIRGTPLMLQIMIIFYMPSLLFGVKVDRVVATIVSFSINYACYFSEIFRSGIQSIDIGQYEAGKVLGLSRRQTFFKVILFQVVKRVTPPLGNEIITLVKDTSLARIISVGELLFIAQNNYVAKGIVWPLFYTGVFYLLFVGLLTLILSNCEKRMSYFEG